MLASGSRISSVAHQPSWIGVGFSPCWFTWGLFLCFAPFPWDKVSVPSACPLLSACCDDLLIVFQFCSVIWLWMLLTSSGDELCGLLSALFQQWLITHLLSALLPFQPLFTESSCSDRLLALPPFSSALTAPCPLCCVLVFSSLFIQLFVLFCFVGWESVCPGGYAGLSWGWLGEYHVMLDAHLLVCWCLPSRFGACVWQGRSPPVF
jgi:hypothetical protein